MTPLRTSQQLLVVVVAIRTHDESPQIGGGGPGALSTQSPFKSPHNSRTWIPASSLRRCVHQNLPFPFVCMYETNLIQLSIFTFAFNEKLLLPFR